MEEQVGGQQRMQLDREPHSDTARAPAGGTAGGAVVDGHSGGPTVVQRKGRVRQQRSEEEAAGTAACRTGQGSPPAQAPQDDPAPRVLVPRRRRRKVQDLAQAP